MAERLRLLLIDARETAGFTQTELAKRLGRTQSLVPNYERGQRRIDVAELILICRALGMDPYAVMRRLK